MFDLKGFLSALPNHILYYKCVTDEAKIFWMKFCNTIKKCFCNQSKFKIGKIVFNLYGYLYKLPKFRNNNVGIENSIARELAIVTP